MAIRRRSGGQVNMTDVAARAGVSQSTVSRVINNHPGISRETRETVLDALRLLGYKADVMSLIRETEAPTLAVTLAMCPLPEQRDPFALEYFSLLAAGVRGGFTGERVDFRLQTLPAGAAELPELDPAGGVILIGFPEEKLRASLREAGVPYVIASGDIYSSTEDMVTVNNFEASAEACRYLLSLGMKRIGFLLTDFYLSRYAGFEAAMLAAEVPIRPEDFRLLPDSELTTFIEGIHNWIASENLPEALVVGTIDAARTARTMLQLQGVRVPADLKIVAFDHHPGSRSDFICLQTNPRELGFRAAKRLLEKFRGDRQPVHIVVPMTLETPETGKP